MMMVSTALNLDFMQSQVENDTSETDQGVFFQGGYFGPKEWSDIKRQRSTREPNLTPITERSEYSTRNSFVSIPTGDRDRARG